MFSTNHFSTRKFARKRCYLLSFLLGLSGLAIAQDDPLNEIIVTAKGQQSLRDSLLSAHIFNVDDIEQIQAKDITTLLQETTGINITDSGGRGSSTGVFLRGTTSAQTIVLIDGIRVGSATLGSAALNSYPLEAISRIEVVKGPLAGIYGADAVGGVIHLFTQDGTAEERGNASLTVGDDSLIEYAIAYRGGSEENNYYLSAQSEETDGIDRTSITTGGNDDIDSFEQTSFSLGGRLQLGDRTFAQLALLQSDNSVEFDNTFGDDTGFFTDSETLSAAIVVTSHLNDVLTWRTTLGMNEDESITPAFGSEFNTERESVTSELEYQLNDFSNLTLGIDYYDESVSPQATFPTSERDNSGVFALYKGRLGGLGLLANVRYDDNSAYGSDTNGSVAVDYQLSESVRVIASYGTAFVAPSFNFLYFPFFGNPDLLPEESDSVELTLKGSAGSLNWRVSAYQTDIENLFSFDPATFLAANIGAAEIEGIEAEVNFQLADWQIAAGLDLLSAENKDTGVELDDRAQQSISLSAAKQFGKFDLRFALRGESDRFDNQGTELASYALVDANLGYQFSDALSLRATVNNLFDKDYTVNLIGPSERYLTEGRQARVKLQYDF